LDWRQEEDLAPKPDRLAFVFGMVLAMAVTIVAITTWAAPPASRELLGCADRVEATDLPENIFNKGYWASADGNNNISLDQPRTFRLKVTAKL
jgi:hypothetical protein